LTDSSHHIESTLTSTLARQKEAGLLRSLAVNNDKIDFCSNDYLSYARSERLKRRAMDALINEGSPNGSTGSRCISGNSTLAEQVEKQIAAFHSAETALLFNSGYDANVGLFSCIAGKGDTIITDELVHASIIDGCRLSRAEKAIFRHNEVEALEQILKQSQGNVFVAVESVYSMDGGSPPLKEIAELCTRHNANLIIDEAHATGVFGAHGRGLANALGVEHASFARVHTFGKALGCHGAVVVGSRVLREYLVNFARSFIFTTALPPHSILTIRCVYEQLAADGFDNSELHSLISYFKRAFTPHNGASLSESNSPIQCVVVPGNERVIAVAHNLQKAHFDVRGIRSPSVPRGRECLRIALHTHNTEEEISALLTALREALT